MAQDRKQKETEAHPQILHSFIALFFVFPSKGVVYFAHHGTILKVFITHSFEVSFHLWFNYPIRKRKKRQGGAVREASEFHKLFLAKEVDFP